MRTYLLETTRYFISAGMIVYTLFAFIHFFSKNKTLKTILETAQIMLITGILGLSYITIGASKSNGRYFLFGMIQLCLMAAAFVLNRIFYDDADYAMLNNICLLMGIGLIMLSSVSSDLAVRQAFIAGCGVCVALFLPLFRRHFRLTEGPKYLYALIGIGLLSAVLILGKAVNGSFLNFSIFGVTIQPSEFVKILYVFFLASAFSRVEEKKEYLLIGFLALTHVGILILSRDLGSALIFFVVFLVMLYYASEKWWILPAGLLAGSAGAFVCYRLFPHVQVRVQAFLDPWSVIDSMGYQVTQSLFAISYGGLFGSGLTKGASERIPFVESDFIFAAIAEEMGLLTAVCVVLICLNCFMRMLRLAGGCRSRFRYLFVTGIAYTYIFQIFLTIGGGTQFIPSTGVTLPLVSYGGSSILATIFVFTLAEIIQMLRDEENRESGPVDRTEMRQLFERRYRQERRLKAGGILVFLLFLAMLGKTFTYAAAHEEELFENDYNVRAQILLSDNLRGHIFSSDGEVLAYSDLAEDGTQVRHYPYGSLFSHVVGYPINGKSGIEAKEDYYLVRSGISIAEKAKADEAGEKYAGNNVFTTLDTRLQEAASRALGIYRGAIVVTEVRTGRVLAMVSKPDFDPASIRENWSAYLEDHESGILLNRAAQGLYPPGSTFKIVDTAAYLNEGLDPDSFRYQCTGTFSYEGENIHCYHFASHGAVDYSTAFAKSCNCAFAKIGTGLDPVKLRSFLDDLYFDRDFPFELPSSVSHAGDPGNPQELVQLSIGQGETGMSPLHLNMITAAAANGGTMMEPYVVEDVMTADGRSIKHRAPRSLKQVLSEEQAAVLCTMMRGVVERGTATKLQSSRYTAAGKTGSAEFDDEDESKSHAWFTGFAPADDPEICVTVIIEGAGVGGSYAVPMAKEVFDAYFP